MQFWIYPTVYISVQPMATTSSNVWREGKGRDGKVKGGGKGRG